MMVEKRGKNIAVAGGVAQLVIAAVMAITWVWTGSLAAMSSMLLSLGGIPLWGMVALLLYCHHLARREEAELRELAEQGTTRGTIFESEEGVELRPAADRVAFMEKWVVPIFTLLWAGLHVVLAVVILRELGAMPFRDMLLGADGTATLHKVYNAQPAVLIVGVVGFAAILAAESLALQDLKVRALP